MIYGNSKWLHQLKTRHVIARPYTNYDAGLFKQPLKLWYGRELTYHIESHGCNYLFVSLLLLNNDIKKGS